MSWVVRSQSGNQPTSYFWKETNKSHINAISINHQKELIGNSIIVLMTVNIFVFCRYFRLLWLGMSLCCHVLKSKRSQPNYSNIHKFTPYTFNEVKSTKSSSSKKYKMALFSMLLFSSHSQWFYLITNVKMNTQEMEYRRNTAEHSDRIVHKAS